eukprot:9493833-Pyramimonas_sp.AAC.1
MWPLPRPALKSGAPVPFSSRRCRQAAENQSMLRFAGALGALQASARDVPWPGRRGATPDQKSRFFWAGRG